MSVFIKITLTLLLPFSVFALSVDHPVNFSDDELGLYSVNDFKKDWGIKPNSSSGQGSRLSIINDEDAPDQKILEMTYLAQKIGGQSGMTFSAPLDGAYDHLFFQYRLKFADDFAWVKGGKLPGLTSAPDSPTGCIDNATFDGFSARYMWRENGLLFGYVYNPEKQERCGDYYSTEPSFYLQTGVWYTIKQEVFLGDPGKANGYINAWVDGQKVFSITNILLRKDPSIHIDQVKMDTFFGGSTLDWAPATDQHAYFDDFSVSITDPDLSQ